MIEDLLIPLKLFSITYCVKYLTYYMRDSQADLQAVGDFQDKSMKLGTNVVLYLSYQFIPRTNLSDPILAAILHHIQQFPCEMLNNFQNLHQNLTPIKLYLRNIFPKTLV